MMLHKRLIWHLCLVCLSLPIRLENTFAQKPVKCRVVRSSARAPKYRIGWIDYGVKEPKILFLSVSINPRHFSASDMTAFARQIKQEFCQESRLTVYILDDYKAARRFAPTLEIEWFDKNWRGMYVLDRYSETEEILFSTAPDKPKDEVKINLSNKARRNL